MSTDVTDVFPCFTVLIQYSYVLHTAMSACISTWHSMIPGYKHQMCLHGSYGEAAKFKCICLKNLIQGVQQSVTKHIKGNLNINKLATTTLQFDAETVRLKFSILLS